MATTWTVKPSGGDYTTLKDAIDNASTLSGDTIEISGSWTSAENTTISLSKNLTIVAVGTAKHPGRPWQTGDTHWRHRKSGLGHAFTITATGSVIFDGLDIQHTGTGVSDEVFRNNVSNTFLAKNCVLGFATRNDQQDIYYNEQVANVTLESCLLYNAYRAVVDLYIAENGSVVNINSCVVYNCGNSSAASSRSGVVGVFGQIGTLTVNIFNSILHVPTGTPITTDGAITLNAHTVISNATNLFDVTYTNINTNTNNVTSATITDSTASSVYILNDVTTSPYDLRITDHANNLAQDNHTNGTGTGTGLSIPATDVVGTSRPQNTNYDIGAFEIEVASSPTGTISEILDNATSAASGVVTNKGSLTETLAATTMAASGTIGSAPTGTITETLDDVVQTSSGTLTVAGSVSYTIQDTTSSGAGVLTVLGSGSEVLDSTTSNISATATISGNSSETLEDVSSAISATITIDGAIVETLANVTPSINGVVGDVIVGNLTETLDNITITANGVVPYTGTIGSVLGDVVMAASGTALLNVSGTISETLENITSSASGTITVQPVGSISETLDNVTSTATGTVQLNVTGTLNEVLANVGITSSGTAGQPTTLTTQDITNIVDAIFSRVIENSETFAEQMKLIRAEAAGKLLVSGTTVTIRDAADSRDRITATVDNNGQRTAVTTDVN